MNTTPPAARAPGGMPASGGSNAALVGLVGIVVGFVVGYGVGRVSTGTPVNPLSEKKGGYEEGYRDAAEKMQASGTLPPTQTTTKSIEGTVKSVGGGRLTIEADVSAYDPLGIKDLPKERTVTITASTEFVTLTPLSPEEFAAAQRAFAVAIQNYAPDPGDPRAPPSPPNPFKNGPLALADLKPGDRVRVDAAADILNIAMFEAVSVTLQPFAPEPGVPQAALPPEAAPVPQQPPDEMPPAPVDAPAPPAP